MDKNAIKKFAVWACRELIERVSQKAMQYGIEKDNIIDAAADSINGTVLTDVQKNQRRELISQINHKGFEEVMEEVAYTWFNRFIALRFMEVNGYLPTRVRVFTDEENNFKPQIIDEALHLDLDGLNMDKVYEFKNANQTEELYKYLLITQCNALNSVLPGMFQRISDYTELLLPDNLLREGSVIEQMISLIPEEDWQDAVQIIGWLYQYYNAEKKDEVFATLKKNVKITKENIPAATQLFTPDWIVRYMVENSLGRLWVEGHPIDELKSGWKYYLEEAEQEPEVQEQLAETRKEYAAMNPEQIKCIDPCCGSGHILAYLFDVLVQIYESYGYTTREAVESIVKNNLYGLDIDDRAAQLAYFAVMMKARQYDRRFFSRQIQPNVYAIQESNDIDKYALDYFVSGDAKLKAAMDSIIKEMHDAKEYGSILNITPVDFTALYARFDEVRDDISMSKEIVLNKLLPLVQVAEALAQKYDVVCTNPPYMGNMPVRMTEYVRKSYTDEKYDLYAVFVKKCKSILRQYGYAAMITQQAWMFLSSFEKFRFHLNQSQFINMLQLGARAFEEIGGEVVQTVTFVFRNDIVPKYYGRYKDLTSATSQDAKEALFHVSMDFFASQDEFQQIPGNVYAYWLSDAALNLFSGEKLGDHCTIKSGIVTGNNDLFLKLWHEISFNNIGFQHKTFTDNSNIKWVPMHKGGGYRKHYGLHEYIMNLHDIWEPSKTNVSVRRGEPNFYFKEGLTWSTLSNNLSVRRSPTGFVFDTKGSMCFANVYTNVGYLEALLNSKVASLYMSILSPTLDFNQGAMAKIPYLFSSEKENTVVTLSSQCVELSKEDWDSYEYSWDFKGHPLVLGKLPEPVWGDVSDRVAFQNTSLSYTYQMYWKKNCEYRFEKLKANEEELNRIFIDIYGLQDELTPDVADKDVTVHRIFDTKDDVPESMQGSSYVRTKRDEVVSLLSYAVGCIFGRYSLDVEGLAYAGGDWDDSKYITYPADKDNIIPICDDEYFDDDMVGRFVKFIETVYGSDTLEENMKFIADALGGKGQPREVIRNYFLNDFYADHCKIYQKRPIYWQFDSGKKNGFKALIYMHRYQPDTIARIRTDYVHEQQSRYRTAIADMENRIANASTSERVKLNKALNRLKDQDTELRIYEEKIHHLADQMIAIDLDDGVKVNYAKFQDVLAKIK